MTTNIAETSIYDCNPEQAYNFILRILDAKLVPFLKSSPGLGKSAMIRAIAAAAKLKIIDLRLTTCVPEDFSGLPRFSEVTPENGIPRASFAPFDLFPLEGDPIPEGYNGWLLFLDEFNSGNKAVIAASYKLVLEKEVGTNKLHKAVHIITAGNLDSDRAITTTIGTAMQSRVITIKMKTQTSLFINKVAIPQKWDGRIISYLSYKESMLNDFKPDHNENTFCCPRTWEFMHRLLKPKYEMIVNSDGSTTWEMDADAPLFAGTITSGVGTDFIQFCRVFNTLPKLDEILAAPDMVDVPKDRATQFAAVTMLTEKTDDKNLHLIDKYINRFNTEFKILFYRTLMIQKPELRDNQTFIDSMVTLRRYLND